jgi:hypothetical protein
VFKRSFFLLFMVAAIGLPYLATSSTDWWHAVGGRRGGDDSPVGSPNATAGVYPAASAAWSPSPTGADVPGHNQQIEGFGARDLAEVLQFDAGPDWVIARWPRVSAALAELDVQGYRVPLVTGTGPDDLAGSLTYYFDKNRRVAQISFHGTTGDPRKLIALVTSRYSFLQQQTDDPALSLYQVKWNGKPLSELRIRPARVLRADQPNSRYEVDLAMKRP